MTRVDLPTPMEWHPYYRDKTYLWDWLNNSSLVTWIPVIPVLRINSPKPDPSRLTDNTLRLTKERAWNYAPYVGEPFIYMWYVATDQYGRSIAGESWRHYIPTGSEDILRKAAHDS